MSVALCNLTLRLPENSSLKGKRMVVKSIQQRLHNRFNVSVAGTAALPLVARRAACYAMRR